MSQNRKWLLLPPAAALLLVLGPLSMQPTAKADAPSDPQPVVEAPGTVEPKALTGLLPQAQPEPVAKSAVDQTAKRPSLPTTPDPWQVVSTLVGLLLLGGTGLFLLRRIRQGPRGTSTGVVVLRQSVRLSPKHSLHAIEFEGRLLLVGESERGVLLVQSGEAVHASADEATIAARSNTEAQTAAPAASVDDSDGAVPKNLVIPRPNNIAQPSRTRSQQPHTGSPESDPSIFHDFRSLLAKVER